jgi:hypothetical protein
VAWEPLVDCGDVDGGFVADGEFVVSGGNGPVALEPVDAALDSVPLLVMFGVERWRAAAVPGRGSCGCGSGRLSRDSAPDPAFAQVGAVGAGAVGPTPTPRERGRWRRRSARAFTSGFQERAWSPRSPAARRRPCRGARCKDAKVSMSMASLREVCQALSCRHCWESRELQPSSPGLRMCTALSMTPSPASRDACSAHSSACSGVAR